MGDQETKLKHSMSRKRNIMAKMMRDGEHKGAFSLKVIDSRKQEYKRKKMRITDIDNEEDEN